MINCPEPIKEISLEGYQIVRGQYFTRRIEPCMTLFDSAISFNGAAYESLNNCDSVQFLVNEQNKCIIVRPVVSKENDAINWNKKKNKAARIECTSFTKQLYEAWGLEADCRYRSIGMLVQSDKKVMILFNFQKAESWRGSSLVKEDGK